MARKQSIIVRCDGDGSALLLLEEQEEFTSRELQEFTGIPQNTVDFNLRKMISEGQLTYEKVPVARASGNSFPTRVYRAVPATSTP